jgi:hypothetical protein
MPTSTSRMLASVGSAQRRVAGPGAAVATAVVFAMTR